MHDIDKVFQQLRFQLSILVAPQDLDNLHPIDLQQQNENWLVFHSKHINMWNNLRRGKVSSSPYEYATIPPLNPRTDEVGPPLAPKQELTLTAAEPMPTPPTSQYVSSYSNVYSNTIIFTQASYNAPHFSASSPMSGWSVVHLSPMHYTPMSSAPLTTTMSMTMYRLSMFQALTKSLLIIPSMYGT
ncbi:hypothetical protein GOBAR_AA05606 [Gossypium barbadense]|uniref:Uncharacterized protein n=1 Tax=Gossypium barbadense TaxID=3634 RepID=A0A2P5YH88_GOSBA|nr:hypothetical protein GOBAR_AA05606 [Gossypium barbadense]